jgi:acetyl esterase
MRISEVIVPLLIFVGHVSAQRGHEFRLDPQAQAMLDKLSAAGVVSSVVTPKDVMQARAAYSAFQAFEGPAEPVWKVEDRQIPGPGGILSIRIYKPHDALALPMLVYFHGGIFTTGSLETHDIPLRALANASGCMIVSVGYRLAPENPFPAAPEDAYAATKWVSEHASEIGGDGTRIAVGGDGAGGNLAAVVALMARDRKGPALRFQLLIYPITSAAMRTISWWDFADGPVLNREGMLFHLGRYMSVTTEIRNPYLSPLAATNLEKLPPALVITAEYDPVRDDGENYAHELEDSGVPVTVSQYKGMVHGFFQMAGTLDAGKRCLLEIAASLKKALFSGIEGA